MDVQRGITAPFADKDWFVKTLWASLWSGLVITAPATSGYTLDYVRNIAYGYETPLPEWNKDFGRWWVRGFLLGLAGFIYMLPAIIIIVASFLPLIASIAASGGAYEEMSRSAGLLSGGLVCGAAGIAFVYVLGVSVFFYGAYVNYALSEDFGALFRVSEILARIRTQGTGYFTAWGLSIAVAFISGTVGSFAMSILSATGVLAPLAGFVAGGIGFLGGLVVAHLFGQYAAAAYGLPGLSPAYMAPSAYASAGYPAPPAAPQPPQAPYHSEQPYQAATPPYAPAPQAPAPAPQAPAAEASAAPAAPAPSEGAPQPASSAHSEPDSPMPSYSPEQTAPPSGPDSDPPAGDGGA